MCDRKESFHNTVSHDGISSHITLHRAAPCRNNNDMIIILLLLLLLLLLLSLLSLLLLVVVVVAVAVVVVGAVVVVVVVVVVSQSSSGLRSLGLGAVEDAAVVGVELREEARELRAGHK